MLDRMASSFLCRAATSAGQFNVSRILQAGTTTPMPRLTPRWLCVHRGLLISNSLISQWPCINPSSLKSDAGPENDISLPRLSLPLMLTVFLTNTGDPLKPPIDRASMRYTSAYPDSIWTCSVGIMAMFPWRTSGMLRVLPAAWANRPTMNTSSPMPICSVLKTLASIKCLVDTETVSRSGFIANGMTATSAVGSDGC